MMGTTNQLHKSGYRWFQLRSATRILIKLTG